MERDQRAGIFGRPLWTWLTAAYAGLILIAIGGLVWMYGAPALVWLIPALGAGICLGWDLNDNLAHLRGDER